MPTSNAPRNTPRYAKWLTWQRVLVLIGIVALVVMNAIQLARPSNLAVNTVQATKVERASAYLQDIGFKDPIYIGLTEGEEYPYPTFTATAIGGESVKLWIRTTPNLGWEVQPVDLIESVASADDFARMAQKAVMDWDAVLNHEGIAANIKPRTDGSWGEYESRKHHYELLAKYNPDPSYWQIRSDENGGWPEK